MPTNTKFSQTKVEPWLKPNTTKLNKAGVGTGRLDCLVLLEDVTGKDRAWLLAHPEFELDKAELAKLDALIKRRAKHEPLAYIRGKTEFYGREFIINKGVLEPRPESETMIDMLKKLDGIHLVADIGTGSGALAITAKLELPNAKVTAVDVDKKCLAVAKANAKKFGVDINLCLGDLFDPVSKPVDVVLANLPYVPNDFTLNDAAMQEPKIAIFGGHDGLDVYRKLFAQIAKLSQKPKYILTESLPFQHKELSKIATPAGYKQVDKNDFIQLFQVAA